VTDPIRVGLVGYGFMGVAHSHAWRTAPRMLPTALNPALTAICGRSGGVEAVARQQGWHSVERSWEALIERDDIDLVDICSPGDTHAEIAIRALDAGKHVLCEKPLANTLEEAEAMVEAATRAHRRGVRSMVGFNYRRVPALIVARRLVGDDTLGRLRHVRVQYLQDWGEDPDLPLVWRFQRERAGSGALGDLGAHVLDLAEHLTGQSIKALTALTHTFINRRPAPVIGGCHHTAERLVDVDDAAQVIGFFDEDVTFSLEVSRFATGHKNALRIEINGSRGSVCFDLERLNELLFYDHSEPGWRAGYRTILVTERDHPYIVHWWPPGHTLGYEHTFVHQAADFLTAIARGAPAEPSFADGLRVQRLLAAAEASAAEPSTISVT
jgi:predicted dehydrogenase